MPKKNIKIIINQARNKSNKKQTEQVINQQYQK